jgi:hypothetical protein
MEDMMNMEEKVLELYTHLVALPSRNGNEDELLTILDELLAEDVDSSVQTPSA